MFPKNDVEHTPQKTQPSEPRYIQSTDNNTCPPTAHPHTHTPRHTLLISGANVQWALPRLISDGPAQHNGHSLT